VANLDAQKLVRDIRLVTGFQAELVAAEPDVHQPVAFAIDERGRLWIAEAFSYPSKQPAGAGKDRVIILEDGDGDGVFETRKVFATGLNLVSGLEVGFGGVWVGAAPELLFIPDRNHDDQPDGAPEVLLDGWGFHDPPCSRSYASLSSTRSRRILDLTHSCPQTASQPAATRGYSCMIPRNYCSWSWMAMAGRGLVDVFMKSGVMNAQGLVTEAGFRTFAELAPDAVLLADARGVIRFANQECERLFRYKRQELTGKSIELLVPERFRERHVTHRAAQAKMPQKRRMRSGLELSARRKDGTEFPAEISLSPIYTEAGPMTCAMVRDMNETLDDLCRTFSLPPNILGKENLLSRVVYKTAGRLLFSRDGALIPGSSIHESGGACMGTDPSRHILNADNQVFDAPNVYVTDSAAFPTNPFQNPALTIMALSARAGHRIAAELKASSDG
jgi:PAS domain S-box-containing protein